jgi:hypothetical protein
VSAGVPDSIDEHAAHCEQCRTAPPPSARLRAVLDTVGVPVDASRLSQLALARLGPGLQSRARTLFWRRLGRTLALSLLPLPLVLAADAVVLRGLYELALAWLPSGVAAYMVLSYGLQFLVLIGAAYAAIPLLIARAGPPADAATA